LLDKSVNNLSQKLDKLYPDTSNNSSDGINYWKGRKIIPLDKWLKTTKANTISRRKDYNVKEGLQYFPDDYFEWMFPLGIPEDLKEEANKWYSDYVELMEYRRNPRIGRTKCFRCLLSPSREESAIFLELNKVIARTIEQEDNSSSTIYPCPILNRYECPFDKKKSNNNNNNRIKEEEKEDFNLLEVDDLFNLSEIAFQIQLALGKAQGMTKSNETIYETDFVSGKVKEICFYGIQSLCESSNEQQNQQQSFNDSYTALILEEAEKLYNGLTTKLTNEIIAAAAAMKTTSSISLPDNN